MSASVNTIVKGAEEQGSFFSRMTWYYQMGVLLVLAGLLVASAMLIQYQRTLGLAGFVLAGVIGVSMVLSILWSDRGHGER